MATGHPYELGACLSCIKKSLVLASQGMLPLPPTVNEQPLAIRRKSL